MSQVHYAEPVDANNPRGSWRCSCGSEAVEQYDHYGIYCGKMCQEAFEEKYIQGPYHDGSADELRGEED